MDLTALRFSNALQCPRCFHYRVQVWQRWQGIRIPPEYSYLCADCRLQGPWADTFQEACTAFQMLALLQRE